MTVLQGQYYRAKKPKKSEPRLVLVTRVEPEEIHYCSGESQYSWEPEEFLEFYEHDPKGREARAVQIKDLMVELDAGAPAVPKLLADPSALAVDDKTLTVRGNKLATMRKGIATTRNSIKRYKRDVLQKQKQLRGWLKEQEYALEGKVKSLEQFLERAQEALWTINLYLGKDETILRLRKGEPAKQDTKIAIRQLTLYMDEECAVAAREGGIGAIDIGEFDKWIVKPRHLQQVLPEERGIVALKVRREMKENRGARPNPEDVYTYFLIRNGERLYRIQTDLQVGGVLFPRRDELDALFFELRWDAEERKTKQQALRPGSFGYMEALKRAAGRKRHYLRCLLFLQGLLDRTKVFAPLPAPRINICNPNESDEFLTFVRDAEMVLTEGREPFDTWLARVNSELVVGHRVMGVFNTWTSRDDSERSYPRGNHPEDLELYTIDREQDRSLVFLFPHKTYRGRIAPRRATYRVRRDDRYILNFDRVEVADMEWFLQSRVDRFHYIAMFPLLKAAIRLKKKEVEEEAPFRKLLTGEIAKTHGVAVQEAAAKVDDLVTWWKFKNRTHRALKKDDSKALRMIVREFKLHRARTKDLAEQSGIEKEIVEGLRKANPEAILIAHRKGRDYAVLLPMNEDNVFVCEQVWTYSRAQGSLEETQSKDWVLLDKRVGRWTELWSTKRWRDWRIGVYRNEVLTDPEIRWAAKWGMEQGEKDGRERIRRRKHSVFKDERAEARASRFLPLAATWDPKRFKLHVYSNREKPSLPKKNLLTGRLKNPKISYTEVTWRRAKGGLAFDRDWTHEITAEINKPPWTYGKHSQFHHEANPSTRLVWSCDENIATLEKEQKRYDELTEERKRLQRIVTRAIDLVTDKMYEIAVEKAHAEFLEDLGDEESWEEELKDLDVRHEYHLPALNWALSFLVERGIDFTDETVKSVVKKARRYGFTERSTVRWGELDKNLPQDFKFPDVREDPPEKEEVLDGEEDDDDGDV